MLSAGLAIALLVACIALLARGPEVRLRFGHYPGTYLALAAMLGASALVCLVSAALAHRMAVPLARWVRGLTRFSGSAAVSAALLSLAVLASRMEAWLVPGSVVIRFSLLAAAVLAIAMLCLMTRPRPLPGIRSALPPAASAGQRLLQAAGSGTAIGLLLLMLLVRAAVCLHFAATSPLLCDEAGTVQVYAKSFWAALTQYDTPNNHLVNSALVRVSTLVFGSGVLAIRLFAVGAGILSPLAVFFLARRLFGAGAGLLAAALESASQFLLWYSFQARGYAFVATITPLLLWATIYALEEPQSARRWKPFVLLSSLALLILPTMLYLWAPLLLFALGAVLYSEYSARRDRRGLFSAGARNTALAFAFVIALAACVYVHPLFSLRRAGVGWRVFHGFLEQPQSIAVLARDVARQSLFGPVQSPVVSPLIGSALAAAGLLGVAALLARRQYRWLYLSACLVAVPALLVAIQRDLPFARNFSFLLTWVHVVAAAGIAELMGRIGAARYKARYVALLLPIAVAGLLSVLFFHNVQAVSQYLRTYRQDLWPAERIGAFLMRNTDKKDAIVCDFCLEYMIGYLIGSQRHITTVAEWWRNGTPDAARVFAVPSRGDHDPEGALARRFLSRACGARAAADRVAQLGVQEVYLCKGSRAEGGGQARPAGMSAVAAVGTLALAVVR